jgi:hypothetical protein
MPDEGSKRCLAGSNSGEACASSYRGRRPSVPEALAARHRKGQCGVWPARGRLQLDPTRQSAQAGEGGGMNQVVAQRCGQALASGERQLTEIGAAGDLSR